MISGAVILSTNYSTLTGNDMPTSSAERYIPVPFLSLVLPSGHVSAKCLRLYSQTVWVLALRLVPGPTPLSIENAPVNVQFTGASQDRIQYPRVKEQVDTLGETPIFPLRDHPSNRRPAPIL